MVAVFLYQVTDDGPSIVANGFDPDARRDQSIPKGFHWLSASRDGTRSGWGCAHMVVVVMPNDVAERYQYPFNDGRPYRDNYLFPTEVINRYQATFRWEPV